MKAFFWHSSLLEMTSSFIPAIVTGREASNSCCSHLSIFSAMAMLQGSIDLVSNEPRQDAKWTVPVALCVRLEAFMDIFT